MIQQEAIEILKEEHDWAQHLSYVNKALNMGIAALEKQIPKKSVIAAMDGFKPEYAATLLCPTCSKQIVNVWNKKDYKPKYCHYCGQALDWSEQE